MPYPLLLALATPWLPSARKILKHIWIGDTKNVCRKLKQTDDKSYFSFAVGRRGTDSTLQSNFSPSRRQSVGNIDNNDKRLSCASVNNNGRLSIGSEKIEADHRITKVPSIATNENNNKTSKIRIAKNNIDQESNLSQVQANKKGIVGKITNTQTSKSWPLDSKLSGAGPHLPKSPSWTAVSPMPTFSNSSNPFRLRPKSRQQDTSQDILTTSNHSVSVPKITISSAPSMEDKE